MMLSRRRFAAASLLLAPLLALAPVHARADEGPLERLARVVPADAAGIVSLSDVAASTRQAGPFVGPRFRELDKRIMPFVPLRLPDGFNGSGIMRLASRDGGEARLGFRLMDIGQIAGWGVPPEQPVAIAGIADRTGAVGAALTGRGFAAREVAGTTVWHVQEDFETKETGRDTDPFAQPIGYSQRFAFRDGILLFSRGWPAMEAMLAGGPSLADDPDAAAILRAGYTAEGRGDLLDVILGGPQPGRAEALRGILDPGSADFQAKYDAVAGRPEFALPGLPPFRRFGLLLWQDGLTMTGAIAIPYADRATAETARERLDALLGAMKSALVDKTFGELLPYERETAIVETAGRAVLVVSYRTTADGGEINPMVFLRNPRRRLEDMLHNGDIGLLLGGTE